MNEHDKTLAASRLDRFSRWVETWHNIRYFGKALGKLGEWVMRILISAWLLAEAWNRLFGK